jgi:hypothetical protein
MSTGWKLKKAGVVLVCAAALCLGTANATDAATQTHHKTKKPPAPLPPLPSGPTGPVQPIPLDSMAPVPPQVSYQNDQLTIVAPNSTLGDILRAVRKQTGAEIEVPAAPERVVTHLGPGPAREVMAELLNGSRFNYVLLGAPANDGVLTRVVLVVKTGPDNPNPANDASFAEQRQPGNMPPNARLQATPEAEAQSADDNTDDAADQAAAEAEAEQQQQQQQAAQPPEQPQPGVKTPQELLQEMQQRQLQFQQQQTPGQPPVPGQGPPPQRQPPQDQQ